MYCNKASGALAALGNRRAHPTLCQRAIAHDPTKRGYRRAATVVQRFGQVGVDGLHCNLEDASEEARAVAEQPAEDAAADRWGPEAAGAADLGTGEDVAHGAHCLEAAEEAVAAGAAEALDHVAQGVGPGQHTAIGAEDATRAVQQAPEQTAQQALVDRSEHAVHSRDRRRSRS